MDMSHTVFSTSGVDVLPSLKKNTSNNCDVVELQLGVCQSQGTSMCESLIREKNIVINDLETEIVKLKEENIVLDMAERIQIELNQNTHGNMHRLDTNELGKGLGIMKKMLKLAYDELCDSIHRRKIQIVEKDQNMNLLGMQFAEAKMAYKSEIVTLKMKLDMCYQEMAAERSRNGQLCSEIAMLKKALDENTKKLCIELRDLGSLMAKNEFLEERLIESKHMECLLQKIKQQKADLRCEIIVLRRENDKLKEENESKLESETVPKEQVVRKEHAELENQRYDSRRLMTELKQLKTTISHQDSMLRCQKRQIDELKRDNSKLQERISEVTMLEKSAIERNAKLRKKLANKEVTNELNQDELWCDLQRPRRSHSCDFLHNTLYDTFGVLYFASYGLNRKGRNKNSYDCCKNIVYHLPTTRGLCWVFHDKTMWQNTTSVMKQFTITFQMSQNSWYSSSYMKSHPGVDVYLKENTDNMVQLINELENPIRLSDKKGVRLRMHKEVSVQYCNCHPLFAEMIPLDFNFFKDFSMIINGTEVCTLSQYDDCARRYVDLAQPRFWDEPVPIDLAGYDDLLKCRKHERNSRSKQELIKQQSRDDCMRWGKFARSESGYHMNSLKTALAAGSTYASRCLPGNVTKNGLSTTNLIAHIHGETVTARRYGRSRKVILLHDNARPHVAISTQ
uniref:MATH domain-containing protein n=1 Tax=Heterorhabditis bacteriophora TaxID=37862 RepID=A0A1I7XI60_HETBA